MGASVLLLWQKFGNSTHEMLAKERGRGGGEAGRGARARRGWRPRCPLHARVPSLRAPAPRRAGCVCSCRPAGVLSILINIICGTRPRVLAMAGGSGLQPRPILSCRHNHYPRPAHGPTCTAGSLICRRSRANSSVLGGIESCCWDRPELTYGPGEDLHTASAYLQTPVCRFTVRVEGTRLGLPTLNRRTKHRLVGEMDHHRLG